MIADKRVLLCQRRLREQRQKGTADVATMDKQHWLSRLVPSLTFPSRSLFACFWAQ